MLLLKELLGGPKSFHQRRKRGQGTTLSGTMSGPQRVDDRAGQVMSCSLSMNTRSLKLPLTPGPSLAEVGVDLSVTLVPL